MAGPAPVVIRSSSRPSQDTRGALTEPRLVRWLLLGTALVFLAFFLFVPLLLVFTKALADGWQTYLASVRDPITLAAVKLTLIAAAVSVPLNLLFGLAAAWAI